MKLRVRRLVQRRWRVPAAGWPAPPAWGASCTVSTYTPARTCDGAGVLPDRLPTRSCGAYMCGATACATSCTAGQRLPSGNHCPARAASFRRSRTAPPARSADCASGFCVDGVCCNTACSGRCKTCKHVGSVGTCRGRRRDRPAQRVRRDGATTCGNDGVCDGAGACRNSRPSRPSARPPAARNGAVNTAIACAAARVCATAGRHVVRRVCVRRRGGVACRTTCAADSDCGGFCERDRPASRRR